MRFSIPITLTPAESDTNSKLYLPINYVGPFLRGIKVGLQKSDYGFYEEMYTKGHKVKNFALSAVFPHAKIEHKKIYVKDGPKNMIMHFTASDPRLALGYFNAFKQMQLSHCMHFNDQVNYTVHNPILESETKIKHNAIVVKTMSPIVVSDGPKGNYLNLATENPNDHTADIALYTESIKASLKHHIDKPELLPLIDTLEILPVKTKATVLNMFGNYTPATTGTIALQADPRLLTEILQSGIGSKRGCFNGMLKVIEQI